MKKKKNEVIILYHGMMKMKNLRNISQELMALKKDLMSIFLAIHIFHLNKGQKKKYGVSLKPIKDMILDGNNLKEKRKKKKKIEI